MNTPCDLARSGSLTALIRRERGIVGVCECGQPDDLRCVRAAVATSKGITTEVTDTNGIHGFLYRAFPCPPFVSVSSVVLPHCNEQVVNGSPQTAV